MIQKDARERMWPPPFKVKINKRCKYLQLKITAHKGLEVVTPRELPLPDILAFIDKKRHWINKHLAKVKPVEILLPESLALRAINEVWHVDYVATQKKHTLAVGTDNQQLNVFGNLLEKTACIKAIIEWLKLSAERHFNPLLKQLSMQFNLPYQGLTIRSQKTRWGSCSHDKRISLNCNLLFLPPTLVQHVLLHELCHTKRLDHSPAFWKLLTGFDPRCEQHRQALKHANSYIPDWITIASFES